MSADIDIIDKGALVRFTGSNLGTVRHIDSSRFTDVVVQAGDRGVYFAKHPNPKLDGWHLITVEYEGETLYVPCGIDHFEVIVTIEVTDR